jgi:hypothetical protein
MINGMPSMPLPFQGFKELLKQALTGFFRIYGIDVNPEKSC